MLQKSRVKGQFTFLVTRLLRKYNLTSGQIECTYCAFHLPELVGQIGKPVNRVNLPQIVFLCAERVSDERRSREDTSFFRLTGFLRKRTLRKSINRDASF